MPSFASHTLRGFTRFTDRAGEALGRLVLWSPEAEPVAPPLHIRPTAEPTMDGEPGDFYVTEDGILMGWGTAGWDAAAAGYTAEQARDDIGSALVAGTGIDITLADGSDTITIAATGGGAPDPHTHPSTDITDFAEAVDDRVGALVVAGTGITTTYNDAAGTLTVASTGGSSASTGAALPWISGRWYDITHAISPFNAVANHVWPTGFLGFQPIYVPVATTVDRIGCYVSAGVASQTARLGVYAMASTGWPGTLEFEAPTTFDIATSGAKEQTISQTLAAGWHYTVIATSGGSPTFSGWNITNPWLQPFGQPGLSNTTAWNPLLYVPFTYAALPSTFPSLSGLASFAGVLRMALRAA